MTGEEFLEKLAMALGFDKYVFIPDWIHCPGGNGFRLEFCKGCKKYIFGYSTGDRLHWPFYVFSIYDLSCPVLAKKFMDLANQYSQLVLLGYLEDGGREDYAISTDARSLEEVLVQAELNAPSGI